MPHSHAFKQLDQQIPVAADLMAQYRRIIKLMKADGRNADAAQPALHALEEFHGQRLLERLSVDDADRTKRDRRSNH